MSSVPGPVQPSATSQPHGSEPAATPADPAADALQDLYRATCAELDKVAPPRSWLAAAGTLLGTAALFVIASVYLSGNAVATTLLLLVPVLLLHELGHYAGMRLLGYRDVSMFFIPFFGAAVSGQKQGAAVWQQVLVLLLGPLPGIFLALGLRLIVAPEPDDWAAELVAMLAVVNAFNLLPIKPLDGGRVVDLLFFAHKPWLAAGFQVLTVIGLAWLAWDLRGGVTTTIFGGLALVMLLTVSSAYGDAVKARAARAQPLALPSEFERLTDAQRRELFSRAVATNQSERAPAALATAIRWLYDCHVSHPPRWPVQASMLSLYLCGIAGAFGTLVMPRILPPEIAAAEAAERRAYEAFSKSRDRAGALADYKTARALREIYLAAHPGDHGRRASLIHTLEMTAIMQSGVEKLATYDDALAVCEQVASRNPSRPARQARLAHCVDNVGMQLRQLGRHEEALAQFHRALTIRRKLAASDPGQWRDDLSSSHREVGVEQRKLGKHGEAVASFQEAIALLERPPASDPYWKARVHDELADALVADGRHSDAVAHLAAAITGFEDSTKVDDNLAFMYRDATDREIAKHGELLTALGRTGEAIAAFRKGLQHREKSLQLADADDAKKGTPGVSTGYWLGRIASAALRARAFERSLAVADRLVAEAPGNIEFAASRAHALMFLGRRDDARAVYLAHRGKVMPAKDATPWERKIAADFAELRQAGLDDALMAEIEAAFGVTGK